MSNPKNEKPLGNASRYTPRPSLIPAVYSTRRPTVEVPAYPSTAIDHPEVRAEWSRSHQQAGEARFLLEPKVLRAFAEAKLACETWDARELGGRKPSGDLRYPIARDRLSQISSEMSERHMATIAQAESTIDAIASGDVIGVEMLDLGVGHYGDEIGIPMLVRQSELDRKRALANRTPEEVEAASAEWDDLVERLIAELPDSEPEDATALEIPNLPELPTDREPTNRELRAFVAAIDRHVRYLERGEQIEAQRERDAAIKVRTAARREAELADPVGTAEAKRAVRLTKAADRQRRWRERQKVSKDRPRNAPTPSSEDGH